MIRILYLPVCICLVLCVGFPSATCSQSYPISITFAAWNNTQFQQLDSIKITNLTQDGDTVLIYPDTVLWLDVISAIHQKELGMKPAIQLFQNSPNPFENQTAVNLVLLQEQQITMKVVDPLGRPCIEYNARLGRGNHRFNFTGGMHAFYLLRVTGGNKTETIKMLPLRRSNSSSPALGYVSREDTGQPYKTANQLSGFVFSPGDQLLFVGYSGDYESGITLSPDSDQLIEFEFATNIPCPGTPTISYGDQTYNTIQVYSQCWMKESLNYETENSWCIYNNEDYCDEYGRLYLWEATAELCPPGWHLPSDTEWKILEGVVDSQHGILDSFWDFSGGWRGIDAGNNLRSLSGWYGGGNGTDLFGFTGKPGGYQLPNGNSGGATIEVGYWTSTEYSDESAWHRFLQYSKSGVYRFPFEKEWGLYVRCIKD